MIICFSGESPGKRCSSGCASGAPIPVSEGCGFCHSVVHADELYRWMAGRSAQARVSGMSGSLQTLQPTAVARGDKADREEDRSGEEIGRRVAARPFLLVARGLSHCAQEIRHADDRDQRRAEEHANAKIDERRNHGAERLGQALSK
jgi:hypothetical protein